MGADSALSNGWTVRETAYPKLFRNGEFIIGCVESLRMTQILEYHLDVPEQDRAGDREYLVTVFVEAVRKEFKKQGFAKVENNEEEGGFFLVGYRGEIYKVENNFQVVSYADALIALGGGEDFALGAMKALEHLPPRERIEKSLEIAAYFSGAVMAPFVVLEGM